MRSAIILGLGLALATGPALAQDFEPLAGVRAGFSFGGSAPSEFNVNGVRVAGGAPEAALNATATDRGERIAITSILATVAGIVALGALATHLMGESIEETFDSTGESSTSETQSGTCNLEVAGECVAGGD